MPQATCRRQCFIHFPRTSNRHQRVQHLEESMQARGTETARPMRGGTHVGQRRVTALAGLPFRMFHVKQMPSEGRRTLNEVERGGT
jgi:hypothetical protein